MVQVSREEIKIKFFSELKVKKSKKLIFCMGVDVPHTEYEKLSGVSMVRGGGGEGVGVSIVRFPHTSL